MEDILAILLIFGGGTAVAISFSPIGRAIADRLRPKDAVALPTEEIEDLRAEVQGLREQVSELAERQDFSERLLAQAKDKGAIGPGAAS